MNNLFFAGLTVYFKRIFVASGFNTDRCHNFLEACECIQYQTQSGSTDLILSGYVGFQGTSQYISELSHCRYDAVSIVSTMAHFWHGLAFRLGYILIFCGVNILFYSLGDYAIQNILIVVLHFF